MPGIELIRSFLQQATAQGSRSTALNPLAWALGLCLSSLLIAISLNAPYWVTVFLSVVTALILIVFLFAYLYLLVKDRDALRSEKFTLSKMAIERSVTGDNIAGFIDPMNRAESIRTPESLTEPKNGGK
jgi:hypothetical protein